VFLAPLSIPDSLVDSSKDLASYQLAFGFYEGEVGEPSMSEVEALICQTNQYMEQKLQDSIGDPQLAAQAVNIDWKYSPECVAAVTVTFAIESSYGDGSTVPAHEVFQALRLGDEELQTFLECFVWKSRPVQENVFYGANQVGFENSMGVSLPQGKLAEASCTMDGGPVTAPVVGRLPAFAAGGSTPASAAGGGTPASAAGGGTPVSAAGGGTPAAPAPAPEGGPQRNGTSIL
jgi:hypothetical protein